MTVLTGTRVVELASDAGALAGKLLADMGADVVLVEPPGGAAARAYPPFLEDEPGPERSLHWWHFHTSKRGITLDLESEAGRELFERLVSGADVLLDAEPADRLSALGIGYQTLAEANPGLVHAAITPFGQRSERRNDPVTDLTLLAGGGPVWSCGYDDHSLPPIRGGGFQSHNIASHYAVMGILTALLHRHSSGRGQFIDVSQHAAANVTTEMASYHWLVQQTTVQRQTGRHAMEHATQPTQVLCADGKHVCSGGLPRKPQEIARLLRWLEESGLDEELPEAIFLEMGAERDHIDLSKIFEDDEVRVIFSAARDAMILLASRLTSVEYFRGAQRAGMAAGVIYAPEEAFEDEHFVARGYQQELEHEDLGRSFRYPGAPYRFEKSPWALQRRAPHLGEHNDEVFAALGVSEEERRALRTRGVI
jgi:crotonobetainyl-CoA:carnitine CoA-transferase CaiB-like acyl-CoA transferase